MKGSPVFQEMVPVILGLGLCIPFLFSLTAAAFEDRIIAVVNKDVITWTDLQKKVQDEYKRLKAKYHGEELNNRFDQKQREVLNNLIDEKLQLQEAKAKGVSVSPEEIESAQQRTPLLPSQSEQDYEEQLLLRKLFDMEVRRTVVVEDEELRKFYEDNQALFLKPPQYRLRQILLTANKDTNDRELAREKAQKIFSAWNSSITLEELAAQFSEQVTPLGWVQENEMLSALSPGVKKLQPGTLSEPIETPLGYHLMLVEEISNDQTYPFETVEGEIHNLLQRQKTEDAYRNWLADLKKKAFIDVKF